MKKYMNINIMLALTTVLIVAYMMGLFFPLYQFHTFNKQVRYDFELANSAFANVFALSDLDLYQDEHQTTYQGGLLQVLVKNNFTDQKNYKLVITINNDVVLGDCSFTYTSQQREYEIELLKDVVLPFDINRADAVIYDEFDQQVAKIDLSIVAAKKLKGYNKVMRMENVTLGNDHLRLGQLVTTLDLSQYDTIALEYRYLIADDLDVKDNNSYAVFEKIEGTPDEILSGTTYGIYYFNDDKQQLSTRPLSVAIILKKGDLSEVIKIDLN